jgi:AcrR family transcriptional regulator
MSPRPRKASDETVFLAALSVMSRLGPTQLTLAHIAAEAGLTAGALVQRFGSKRGLLIALSEHYAGSTAEMFQALRAPDSSALGTLYAYADCMAQMGKSPEALAHNLSWFQQDLSDPDLRRNLLIHARASRRELQRLVQEGIADGSLRKDVKPASLARAIEVTVGGSLMAWAVHQEGTATSWVRSDLKALLDHYVRDSASRRRRSSAPSAKRATRVGARRVRAR